jgi:hypothetical protein
MNSFIVNDEIKVEESKYNECSIFNEFVSKWRRCLSLDPSPEGEGVGTLL